MYRYIISFLILVLTISGCGNEKAGPKKEAALGSAQNPIKMALVPSLDTKKLVISGEKLADLLQKQASTIK